MLNWLSLFLLAVTITACSSAGTTTSPTPAPTPASSLPPSPSLATTAVLLAPEQPRNAAEQLARRELEQFVSEKGWVWVRMNPGEEILRVALQSNPVLVAVVGSGLGQQVAAAAATHPDVRFVVVEDAGATPMANLLIVGGENVRHDQAAFLAGLLATVENGNDYVGWIGERDTIRGTIYRNGFRHGVRFICPLCQVFDYELESSADLGAGLAAADSLVKDYADTASAIPSPAGNGALQELAKRKIRVAGAQPDFFEGLFGSGSLAGAKNVLGGLAFRPDLLLADLLPRFLNGETFDSPIVYSLENGGMEYAPFPNQWISPGRGAYLQEIIEQVASGRLDIGVDRQSGEER